MGSSEAILGATIGSGVAAGASTALGNSTTGHIISGIAGGIAGRTAGRVVANRLRNRNRMSQPQELQPLLNGHRLGGSGSGRSRLNPEIQETTDASTGERTQWTIPQEEAMSSIRRAANRTMKNVSKTVSNLKDQISDVGESIMGTIRRRGRPRSSVFPKSDDKLIEEVEGSMRWKEDMRQNEQNRNAANRLGAALKRKKEENTIGFKKIENENEQLEKRIATNRLGAALKRKKEENTIGFKRIENENDQLMEILQKPKNQAASKLQDAIRRKLPLTTSTQQLQNSMLTQMKKQRNDSATDIQRLFRGSKTRKIIKNKIRQDNVKKGSEIVERMKQDQYNTYLQDEAASNFGVLSKGVVKQQRKALQDQLKQVQGHQLLKDIKKDNTAVNFEFMTGDTLRQQRKGIGFKKIENENDQLMEIIHEHKIEIDNVQVIEYQDINHLTHHYQKSKHYHH